MPEGLSRRYGQKHLHFIIFSCNGRLPLLGSAPARNSFLTILGEVRERYCFVLPGYVVMPEHVHLLISEPPRGTPSTVLQVLKQCVSRSLRMEGKESAGQMKLSPEVAGNLLPKFWEARFYDFNVWSQKKFVEKLHYMHMNPVKRGLVEHPRDWAWSSFSFYAKSGDCLLRVDPMS
jgi:REP-associated tyrosine transposase